MRAAVVTSFAGPEAITVRTAPEPQPGDDQLLVDVAYAGVTFPDLLQSRGEYQRRPTLPFVPGWEVAGVVRADAGGFRAGDRVAALPCLGGFAEVVAIDARMAFRLPDSVGFEKAAALPLNYLTVHLALLRRAAVANTETVLVHGAAGGVGSAACQLAAALGCRVIAVVSTAAKAELARAVGAVEVVAVGGFREAVRELTDGVGVDVIVDPVGGDRFTDSLRCLAPGGRLVVVGFTGGEIPTVRVNRLLLTNTTVMGSALIELYQDEPHYAQEQWRQLLPMIESGALDPPIRAVYSLDQVGDALAAIDRREMVGRAVVRISD